MSLTSHTKNSATLSATESTPRSLYDAILGGTNSLNFIRLSMATLVIIAHSAPLVGFTTGFLGIPAPHGIDSLGHWAVNMFFCISGFLIAHSAQRGTITGYLKRRILRIFPGYWVSILFVVFLCGPIAVVTGHTADPFSIKGAGGYIIRNFDLFNLQYPLFGGPTGIPFTHAWNGSAWTLSFEFLAYLALIPIFYIGFIRKNAKWLVPVIYTGLFFGHQIFELMGREPNHFVEGILRLHAYFFAGTLLYMWGKRIRYNATVAIVVTILGFALQWFAPGIAQYMHLPVAYGILALSAAIKTDLCRHNDISYGVYIYAFPVQIMLTIFGSASLGWVLNAIITFVITIGLAWLSWLYVEKPALALKDRKLLRIRRDRSADAVAASS